MQLMPDKELELIKNIKEPETQKINFFQKIKKTYPDSIDKENFLINASIPSRIAECSAFDTDSFSISGS